MKVKKRKNVFYVKWQEDDALVSQEPPKEVKDLLTVWEAFNENFFNDYNLKAYRGELVIFKDATIELGSSKPYLEDIINGVEHDDNE